MPIPLLCITLLALLIFILSQAPRASWVLWSMVLVTLSRYIFVADIDGRLSGACMVGYDGHRGWLYAVAVLPEQRRGTIGAALVQHAIQTLRQLGCIKVNLQIRSTNTEVAAFYQSLGFEVEDRLSMGIRL